MEGLGHSRSDVVHLICGPGNGPYSLVSPTALTCPSDRGRQVLLILVGSCDSWKVPTSHRSGHTVTLTHSRTKGGAGCDHMTGTREGLGPGWTLDPNSPAAGRFVGTGDTREQDTLLLLAHRGASSFDPGRLGALDKMHRGGRRTGRRGWTRPCGISQGLGRRHGRRFYERGLQATQAAMKEPEPLQVELWDPEGHTR